jgi:Trypsin/PEP-CTERM motif
MSTLLSVVDHEAARTSSRRSVNILSAAILPFLVAGSAYAGVMRPAVPNQISNQISSPGNNIYQTLGADLPSVVGILAIRPSGAGSCSGVFISANTVLTAAHCLYNGSSFDPPTMLAVRTGTNFLDNNSPSLMVNSYVVNPSWKPSTGGAPVNPDDLALLQVGLPGFATPSVATLYNPGPVVSQINQIVKISGYGDEYVANPGFGNGVVAGPQFPKDALKLVKLAGLSVVTGQSANILQTTFLGGAARLARGLPSNFPEFAMAPGDSGGGLFINGDLAAINESDFLPLTGEGSLTDYTYLPGYANWISSNTFGPINFAGIAGLTPSDPFTPTTPGGKLNTNIFGFSGFIILPYTPYYFDPAGADAYVFQSSASAFSGFEVPFDVGTGIYQLLVWDSVSGKYIFAADLTPDEWYQFGGNGVQQFLIEGVAGANASTFGLEFETGGDSDFTQSVYSVMGGTTTPEPATWAMMLIGFAGLGYAGYRRAIRRQRTA